MSDRHSNSHPDGNAAVLRGNVALVVGHPGHELRIHHWVEIARPLTFVLTDGSGRGQPSRLPSTEKILRTAGATPASIYGRWTDAQAYEILLSGNLAAVADVTRELAEALIANDIEAVVADAMEGFNPTHDICRYIANAAVLLARCRRSVATYDFIVGGPPPPNKSQNGCVRVELDADALDRKLDAARNYPELRREVLIARMLYGRARFATEFLRPIEPGLSPGFSGRPRYEIYGEKRVKAGRYNEVIRYQQHVLPLMEALWRELDLPA